jgi:hypothetical protein
MTAKDKEVFLDMIRRGWNEAGACHAIGYTLGQLARKKRALPEFAAERRESGSYRNHSTTHTTPQSSPTCGPREARPLHHTFLPSRVDLFLACFGSTVEGSRAAV